MPGCDRGVAEADSQAIAADVNSSSSCRNSANWGFLLKEDSHAILAEVECDLSRARQADSKTEDTLCHRIAMDGDHRKGLMSELLRARADPNACNDTGETPLHVAAACGHSVLCQILLAAGARPELESVWREAAVDVAARHGHTHILSS